MPNAAVEPSTRGACTHCTSRTDKSQSSGPSRKTQPKPTTSGVDRAKRSGGKPLGDFALCLGHVSHRKLLPGPVELSQMVHQLGSALCDPERKAVANENSERRHLGFTEMICVLCVETSSPDWLLDILPDGRAMET